jgi:MYXO-CTERM domain-containing protein
MKKGQSLKKLTGLSAASIAMGTSADAALIASTTIPAGGLTTPSNPGTINWDVDNDGTNDFKFTYYTSSSSTSSLYYGTLAMEDLGDARIARPVSSPYFEKLTAGAKLGTANDGLSFYVAQNRALINMSSSSFFIGANLKNGGWSLGDTGYFGFKFTSNGNTHYGWAEMTLSNSTAQATINEAWYNDTPDGSVTVGNAVPEPAEVGLGLGVLALGAAGLRRMRQNRKAA